MHLLQILLLLVAVHEHCVAAALVLEAFAELRVLDEKLLDEQVVVDEPLRLFGYDEALRFEARVHVRQFGTLLLPRF